MERERREAAAALKAAEGDRLLADAAAAVLRGTLHNAEVLLREADAAFVAAGQDEVSRPRPSPVFRSAICDCLSLISFSLCGL